MYTADCLFIKNTFRYFCVWIQISLNLHGTKLQRYYQPSCDRTNNFIGKITTWINVMVSPLISDITDYYFIYIYKFACLHTKYSFRILQVHEHGNVFCSLWGEYICHRWIPRTEASNAELWCFVWSAAEVTVVQTMETQVIWDAITLIMTSL